MNPFFENLQNNSSLNPLKEIQNLQLKNNIPYNYFNNIKTNNNNINNFIYFSPNKSLENNKPQNFISLPNNDNIHQISEKISNTHNQFNQISNNNIGIINEKINLQSFKNNKKYSFDSSKENKNMKNINIIENHNINDSIKNKNLLDSLSEVKKFKTELCHSWELTGTCKYGQNVINYYLIIYNIIFFYSVYLLMVLWI